MRSVIVRVHIFKRIPRKPTSRMGAFKAAFIKAPKSPLEHPMIERETSDMNATTRRSERLFSRI